MATKTPLAFTPAQLNYKLFADSLPQEQPMPKPVPPVQQPVAQPVAAPDQNSPIHPDRQAELLQKLQAVKNGQTPTDATSGIDPARQQELLSKLQAIKGGAPATDSSSLLSKIRNGAVDLARPIVRGTVTGLAALEDAGRLLTGNYDENTVSRTAEGYNVPGFGQVKPDRIAKDIEINTDANGKKSVSGGQFGAETLRTIGTGAEIAPWLMGGGEGVEIGRGLLEETAKKTLGNAIKREALVGGIAGATAGAGSELSKTQEGENVIDTAGRVAKGTLFGGATGAVLGPVFPIASEAAGLTSRIGKTILRGAEDSGGGVLGVAEKGFNKLTGRATPEEALIQRNLLEQGAADSRIATKTLQEGRVVADKEAKEAVRQGIPEGDVALIKSSGDLDKEKMLEMVERRERGATNKRAAVTERASGVVGDTTVEKILKPVDKLRREAGAAVDKEARALSGKTIDTTEALSKLGASLDATRVKIKNGKLIFEGSQFEGLPDVQKKLQLIYDRAKRLNTSRDALEAHDLKRFIDEQVEYGARTEGLHGDAEDILKGFRKSIDDTLDKTFPKYNKANTDFKEAIGQIEKMSTSLGKKFKLNGEFVDEEVGTKMRAIMSNSQKRAQILDMLDGMQKLLAKHGRSPDEDVVAQALFADTLEKLLGTEASTGLQGEVGGAIAHAKGFAKAGADLMNGKPAAAAIQAGEHIYQLTRGVNEENQIKALKELLKRDIANGSTGKTVFGTKFQELVNPFTK